jgi:adenosylmethionine-8-amino-7-oxononanoate aminotransferase
MTVQPKATISIAASALPKVAWGEGLSVYDTNGKRYIDGSGGPAVYCLGHGNREVNAAMQRNGPDRPAIATLPAATRMTAWWRGAAAG